MADFSGLAALFGGVMKGYGEARIAQQQEATKADQTAIQSIFTAGLKDPSIFQSEAIQKMVDTHFGQKGLTAHMGEQIQSAHEAGHKADMAGIADMIDKLNSGGQPGGQSQQAQGQPQQAAQPTSQQTEAIPTRFQAAQPGAASGAPAGAPAGAPLAPATAQLPMPAAGQLTGGAPGQPPPGQVTPHPTEPGTYVGSKYHWSVDVNMKDPAASKFHIAAATPAERKDRAFQVFRTDLKKTGSVDESLDNLAQQGLALSGQDSAALRKEAANAAFIETMKKTSNVSKATAAAFQQGGADFAQEHQDLMHSIPGYTEMQAGAKGTITGAEAAAKVPSAVKQESDIATQKDIRESREAQPLASMPPAIAGRPEPVSGTTLPPKLQGPLKDIETQFNTAIAPLKTKLNETVSAQAILASGKADKIAQTLATFSLLKGHLSRTTEPEINRVLAANGFKESAEQFWTNIQGKGTLTPRQLRAVNGILQAQKNTLEQEIGNETQNAVDKGRGSKIPEAHLANVLGDWYTKKYPTTTQAAKTGPGIGNLPAQAGAPAPLARNEALAESWTAEQVQRGLASGALTPDLAAEIRRAQPEANK